ncbi:hypothetical protein LCY76_10265 [Fictibacillus sp. KIGAM418]|uniref:Uncharacterized protein n=1 Tax=Fictibacillus marinisediminis TaxID=2878389 RepID=A0A9X1XG65_9BACL|nr:hypothetical protein [Fictibacillus marinisediminis]MCK6256979.1 hypothetical protein [Fictibacillus marinisediminis]
MVEVSHSNTYFVLEWETEAFESLATKAGSIEMLKRLDQRRKALEL